MNDVKTPILGADFLHSYNLLVDVRNHQLVNGPIQVIVYGVLTQESSPSPAVLPKQPRNEYKAIFKRLS